METEGSAWQGSMTRVSWLLERLSTPVLMSAKLLLNQKLVQPPLLPSNVTECSDDNTVSSQQKRCSARIL